MLYYKAFGVTPPIIIKSMHLNISNTHPIQHSTLVTRVSPKALEPLKQVSIFIYTSLIFNLNLPNLKFCLIQNHII